MAVVDRATASANGRFRLSAAARASGLALFDLRLKDGSEHIEIPVETYAQRLLTQARKGQS